MPSRVKVGGVEIVALSDGVGEFDPAEVWPGVPAEAWAHYPGALSPTGHFCANFGCYLLRSQGQTILVDTGVGWEVIGMLGRPRGRLMEELKSSGVATDDVSFVVLTHLHPDHVGWNVKNEGGGWRPTFAKARYLLPEADWDFFHRPKVLETFTYIKDTVTPLMELGNTELIGGERTITSEIVAVPTPGHTPGHTSLFISSHGQRGVILGDVSHTPVQAHETDWAFSFDVDPELARQTRHRILDRLEAEGALICAGHYPAPGFGRLLRREGRRYWQVVQPA